MEEVINTKIAGVSFHAKNFSSLKKGMKLNLIREPENPHDPNAVLVQTPEGDKLGYVNTKNDLAFRISKALQETTVNCEILEVTGGEEDKNYGVNIQIQVT